MLDFFCPYSNLLSLNTELGGSTLLLVKAVLCPKHTGFLGTREKMRGEECDHVLLVVVGVQLDFVSRIAYEFHGVFVDLLVPVVQSFAIVRVAVPLVEVGVRLFVDVGVAKKVQEIAKFFFDVSNLFRRVAFGVDVQLARSRLELVGLGSRTTLGNDLVDTALHVGALDVVDFEEVLENALISFLGCVDEILIAHDVDWIKV